MAKETKILKLYQVTRPEDDDKAFNIQTMLNDNWDKIDKAFEKASTAEAEEGTNTEKIMTPKTTKDAILKLAPQLEYKDILNLSATPAGVITWALSTATDGTRTAIVLCRATKDISNMDYAACLSDASITKNTLAQNATSNTYTGLTTSTQYWVKAFVKYALGGKEFYSNGATVTFATPAIVTPEFYNAGNEFTAITGGWAKGYMAHEPVSYVTKNANNITLYSEFNDSAFSVGNACIVTTNKIDLSQIKTLKFLIDSNIVGLHHSVSLGITDRADGRGLSSSTHVYTNLNQATISLDVTNLIGQKYISCELATVGASTNAKIVVYRIWGEGFDTSLKPNVTNLTSTQSGAVSWTLPTDNAPYRTDIEVFKATKDISNFDHATCVADGAVTKTTLGKDVTNTTLSGLVESTQYWVKVFVKYTVDGVESYSSGVGTSFTYVPPVVITEFYNAGNEFTSVTGGWKLGAVSNFPPSRFEKSSNHFLLNAVHYNGVVGKVTTVTTNTINLSSILKLKVELEVSTNSLPSKVYFIVGDNSSGIGSFLAFVEIQPPKSRQMFTLDVSSMVGNRYISIHSSADSADSANNVLVYRVWGES